MKGIVNTLVKELENVSFKIQRVHNNNGNEELYGSNEGDLITLAVDTCMKDGREQIVIVAIHELLHAVYPEMTEKEVEEMAKELYYRSYKLRAIIAERIIEEIYRRFVCRRSR